MLERFLEEFLEKFPLEYLKELTKKSLEKSWIIILCEIVEGGLEVNPWDIFVEIPEEIRRIISEGIFGGKKKHLWEIPEGGISEKVLGLITEAIFRGIFNYFEELLVPQEQFLKGIIGGMAKIIVEGTLWRNSERNVYRNPSRIYRLNFWRLRDTMKDHLEEFPKQSWRNSCGNPWRNSGINLSRTFWWNSWRKLWMNVCCTLLRVFREKPFWIWIFEESLG